MLSISFKRKQMCFKGLILLFYSVKQTGWCNYQYQMACECCVLFTAVGGRSTHSNTQQLRTFWHSGWSVVWSKPAPCCRFASMVVPASRELTAWNNRPCKCLVVSRSGMLVVHCVRSMLPHSIGPVWPLWFCGGSSSVDCYCYIFSIHDTLWHSAALCCSVSYHTMLQFKVLSTIIAVHVETPGGSQWTAPQRTEADPADGQTADLLWLRIRRLHK